MTARELLEELERRRISIWLAADKYIPGERGLEWRGERGAMTAALRARVIARRDELIALLALFPPQPCATCGGQSWAIVDLPADLFSCRGCGAVVMVDGLAADEPSNEDGPT